jgi:hypothetical protein
MLRFLIFAMPQIGGWPSFGWFNPTAMSFHAIVRKMYSLCSIKYSNIRLRIIAVGCLVGVDFKEIIFLQSCLFSSFRQLPSTNLTHPSRMSRINGFLLAGNPLPRARESTIGSDVDDAYACATKGVLRAPQAGNGGITYDGARHPSVAKMPIL